MNLFNLAYFIKKQVDSDSIPKELKKHTNFFSSYFQNIDWDGLISKIISTTILVIVVSVLFFILNSIGKKIIKKSFHKPRKNKKLSPGRVNTIYSLTLNIFHYTILFFYFYAILSVLGIPVGTLLAGASILSVAIGLGAQGFVTDMVTGLFILAEQQFTVGENVKLDSIEGTVHAIGLRTTQIMGYDGILHFVPNRNIKTVSNFSRNDMRAIINIHLQPGQNITKIEEIITEVNDHLVPENQNITKGPDILGMVDTGNGALAIRISIFTKNGAQGSTQRQFLQAYYAALQDNGIKVAPALINLTY